MKISTLDTWNTFSNHIFNFIKSKVNSDDDAKDILQNVFIKVHSNIHKLKEEEKLKSWLFSITRNSINDFWKNNKYKELEPISEIEEDENNWTSYFETCLSSMIKELPYKYQEAIILSEINNKSQKEIAQKLNLTHSAIKSRVQRGRKLLKDNFDECCNLQINKSGQIVSGDLEMEHCSKCNN